MTATATAAPATINVPLLDLKAQYGPLKNDTADAVVELLAPIRARHTELAADPAEVHRILDAGAERARKTAATTLARARAAVGLLPPR